MTEDQKKVTATFTITTSKTITRADAEAMVKQINDELGINVTLVDVVKIPDEDPK